MHDLLSLNFNQIKSKFIERFIHIDFSKFNQTLTTKQKIRIFIF